LRYSPNEGEQDGRNKWKARAHKMSTTGNLKRKGYFETLRTVETVKTKLDCEVANWVQVAHIHPMREML
jgi:hypothetical protein